LSISVCTRTLYADAPGGGKVYERLSQKTISTVIIIDECHRKRFYGDWGAILNYFEDAFHLGMTAHTEAGPNSIDTYTYFASEEQG